MKLTKVRKRSGQKVNYDREKIHNAIVGANRDASTNDDKLSADDVELVTDSVERAIAENEIIGVEEIQDQVEKSLMAHGFYDVAKQFIVYRQKHSQRRAAQKKLMDTYRDIFFADRCFNGNHAQARRGKFKAFRRQLRPARRICSSGQRKLDSHSRQRFFADNVQLLSD